MDEPLIDLQTRFAHQQQELEQLTATVVHQQREIDILKGAITALQHQLRELAEHREQEHAAEPPPPHY